MITCNRGHKFRLFVGDRLDKTCLACAEEDRLKDALLDAKLTQQDVREMLSEAFIYLIEQGAYSPLIVQALKEVEDRKM